MTVLDDVYYWKDYVSLYLKDNESVFEFNFEKGDKCLYNIAIKRPITKIGSIAINENYYDLETAYGYGGLFCNSNDPLFIEEALKAYSSYCETEHIIAEFSRIHPFNTSHEHFNAYYDLLIEDRKTVSVNTTLDKTERWANYPSKIRTILRKCEKELSFKRSEDIDTFMALYEATMAKNNAEDFYYFDKNYFVSLLKVKGIELYEIRYDNVVISMSFFMFSAHFGHYHLSANHSEYRKLNANYFILDSIFDVAHQKGIQQFHLGGGRTNLPDDALLRFKSKFSDDTQPFSIAGKVFNRKKYNEYVNIWESQSNDPIKYFLKYRLNIN